MFALEEEGGDFELGLPIMRIVFLTNGTFCVNHQSQYSINREKGAAMYKAWLPLERDRNAPVHSKISGYAPRTSSWQVDRQN